MRCRALAAFATFLILPLAAAANDGWFNEVGSPGAYAGQHPDVQMVSEVVSVRMTDDASDVRATFVFRNHGRAQTVRMAFPANYQNAAGTSISRMRSTVDGAVIRLTYKVVLDLDDIVKAVYWKDVAFGAGQTRTVTVSYRDRNWGSVLGDRGFAYVFATGSTWKGVIKRIDVTVDTSGMKTQSRPEFSLERNLEIKTGTVPDVPASAWRSVGPCRKRLTLRDIEPGFDLLVTTRRGFWNFRLNGQRLPQIAQGYYVSDVWGYVSGPLGDLWIATKNVPMFFGAWAGTGNNRRWRAFKARAAAHFGRYVAFVGNQEIRTGDGRTLRLARPLQWRRTGDFTTAYVRLRDLIRALGGTYTAIPGDQRVDITFP